MIFRLERSRKTVVIITTFFVLLLLETSMKWVGHNFDRINMDEIALVMQIGMRGLDSHLFWSFIKRVILRSVLWTGILTLIYSLCHNRMSRRVMAGGICAALVALVIGRGYSYNFQAGSFFQISHSTFYEQEYADPNTVKISFPTRRNVLVIALESMEKTYANPELFGPGGITPNITRMERENVSFNRYDSISGLSHTIAAITGFTTGLPLFFTNYRNIEKMMGATGIGTVFKNNGYNTAAIFPASGQFSLKGNFMRRMGFDIVIDGVAIRESLTEPLDIYPFDGVDDATLFEKAKPEINALIKSGAPYFLFMETINTHIEGYHTRACRDMGFEQKTMEDIAKCDDKIIADFVAWFRARDPNAVVILLNDHPQRGGLIGKRLNGVPERHLANVFINTPVFKRADKNRPVLALDFFPTVIEAAGGIIDGCRLGLGVSLSDRCAGIQTLRERYGDRELASQMEKRNKLYMQLNTGKK